MNGAQRLSVHGAVEVERGVLAFLNRGRGDAGDERAVVLLHGGQVADDEDVGMAGDGEVGLDEDAAGAIERHAEGRASGEACTPAPQSTVRVGMVAVADAHLVIVDVRDDRVGDAPRRRARSSCWRRLLGEVGG